MNRTFLIIVLVGCLALYLFWDDIVSRRKTPEASATKTTPVAMEAAQKFDAPLMQAYTKIDSIKL